MESSSTVACSDTSKVKHLKKEKADEDEDIISKLPKELISLILSLLPTKEAVRTSVLSKRWINHWTSITKLDLDELSSILQRKRQVGREFVNFVNRALLLTKYSSMESCSLIITNKYDALLVNTWISSILIRKIKKLRIHLTWKLPFSSLASHSLFKSCCLEELVLNMFGSTIKVPPGSLYFGHLKFLELFGIIFTIDSSNDYLSLPVLKKFETINCIWLSENGITLEAPLLESIIIKQDFKSVSLEPRSGAICFSTLHLTEFVYWGYGISQSIILSDPSSVHDASATIGFMECENRLTETESYAFQFLKQFSQVKHLRIWGLEVLTQPMVADLPVFGMLSHLELYFVGSEDLLGLLLKSPVLKTLDIEGISKLDQEKLNSAIVPNCLTSTLKIVKFGKVRGSHHEMCLAKFVMENGLVLEKISFFLSSQFRGRSKATEEFKKLFAFKTSSPFAIVEFTY